MKKTHTIVLLVVSVVLVFAFFAMRKNKIRAIRSLEEKIGTVVFADAEFHEIISLKIFKGANLKVEINKADDIWTVANLYNYPANPSKLLSFTSDISQMRNMKMMNVEKAQLERLELDLNSVNTPPFKIEMNSKSTKVANFLAGKKHTRKSDGEYAFEISDGRFLLIPGKNEIIIIDKPLHELEYEASDWIDQSFFSVEKLKNASLYEDGKSVWTLSRNTENEEMKLQNPPEGKEIDSAKISEISSTLAQMSFAKIADPNTKNEIAGLDKAKVFTAENFDGIKYTLKIGKKENSDYYVRVSAEYNCPSSPVTLEKEKPEDSEKQNKDKTEEINKKYSPWLYMIAESKLKSLIAPLDDFMKKKDEQKQ